MFIYILIYYIYIFFVEWTETDDSGGMRQITQIKTETSIKLEGEGMFFEHENFKLFIFI